MHLVEASRVLATVVAPLVHLRRLINPRDLVETRGNTLAMVAMNLLATGDSKNLCYQAFFGYPTPPTTMQI